MFFDILRFELAYHLRRPSTYVYMAVLFAGAFLITTTSAGDSGRLLRNAPATISVMTLIFTVIGLVITTGIVGLSVLRDFQMKTHELYFTTPMSKSSFLAGRFVGSYLSMVVVYLGIPLGLMIGCYMPWVDASKLGPFHLWWYLVPAVTLMLPTLFFAAAVFFAVGILTRSVLFVYTTGMLLFVTSGIATILRRKLDSQLTVALTDPFGIATYNEATRYWTVIEQNSLVAPLSGYLLLNRLFFIALGLVIVVASMIAFRTESVARARGKKKQTAEVSATIEPVTAQGALVIPRATQRFDAMAKLGELVAVTRFSFQSIVREVSFVAIALIGFILFAFTAWTPSRFYGSELYPTTYAMAENIVGAMSLFMTLIITIYAGELVWRERSIKADQVNDATPASPGVAIAGRVLGLVGALALMYLASIVVAIIVQVSKGYTHFELGLYLRTLFLVDFHSFISLTLIAFFVHTLVNNKYLGHAIMVLLYVAVPVASQLGLEHRLFDFASVAPYTYSDMNGFGPSVPRIVYFALYWFSFAMLLAIVASLFWVRGTETGWHHRLFVATQRFTRRAVFALGTFMALTLTLGGWIFYNSNVMHRYTTQDHDRKDQADYEKKYKRFKKALQPRITDIVVRADLEPDQLAFALRGSYTLVNKRQTPIDTIFIANVAAADLDDMVTDSIHLDRATKMLPVSDTAVGIRVLTLSTPLAPGDTMHLGFGMHFKQRGFGNGSLPTMIAANGTFINSSYLPAIGYQDDYELASPDERKKQKLPVRERRAPITDTVAVMNNQISNDADWISLDATITTPSDQIALAPGYLQDSSTANGRRTFHYRTEAKILNFFSFLSARYAVRRDVWQKVGQPPVAIEVLYHPAHDYNVARMITGVKKAFDYYTAAYGPYQFRQLRILEFPRYASFAQSFPNTIPYSEGIGFIAKVGTKDDDIDTPFFVTAHEVAHQWWAHQVIGGDVQGADIMVESLAEYSALMVMRREYGAAAAQKFLRYEQDAYLSGRAGERIREQPLRLTEGQQYIHYYKGALVFYALGDLIGEDRLNGALKSFLDKHRYPTPPYPTSDDLIRELRAATPDSLQHVITDLFETITLFDNKADSASWTKRADGKYVVRLAYSAKKLRADSLGGEHEIPVDDYVDVGVFGAKEKGNSLGKPLSVMKMHVQKAKGAFEIVVNGEPVKAGIDPYNKLIDRRPRDNVMAVQEGAKK